MHRYFVAVAALLFLTAGQILAANSGGSSRTYFANPVADAVIDTVVPFPDGEQIRDRAYIADTWRHRVLEIYNQDWIGFRIEFDTEKGEIQFKYARENDGEAGFFLPSGAKTEVLVTAMSLNLIGDIDYHRPMGADGTGDLFYFGPAAKISAVPPTPTRIYLLPEAANGLMATSVKVDSGGWVTSQLLMPYAQREADAVPEGFDFTHDPDVTISIPEDGRGEQRRPRFSEEDLRASMVRRQQMGPPRPRKKDPSRERTAIRESFVADIAKPERGTFIEIENLDFVPYRLVVDPVDQLIGVLSGDATEGMLLPSGSMVSIPSAFATWTLRGGSGLLTAVPVPVHPIATVSLVPMYSEGRFGMRAQVGDKMLGDSAVMFKPAPRPAEGWPKGYNPADYVK